MVFCIVVKRHLFYKFVNNWAVKIMLKPYKYLILQELTKAKAFLKFLNNFNV